jgi:hypothetical protein
MSSPLIGNEEQHDMKQISTSMIVSTLLTGWLFIMPVESLLAAEPQLDGGMAEESADSTVWSGPFDGYSEESGRVWVNDMVFLYTDQSKVIGTANKLGLLSDIDLGETVSVLFEDTGDGGIPHVLEIRRR